jgi:hypothetical protein
MLVIDIMLTPRDKRIVVSIKILANDHAVFLSVLFLSIFVCNLSFRTRQTS